MRHNLPNAHCRTICACLGRGVLCCEGVACQLCEHRLPPTNTPCRRGSVVLCTPSLTEDSIGDTYRACLHCTAKNILLTRIQQGCQVQQLPGRCCKALEPTSTRSQKSARPVLCLRQCLPTLLLSQCIPQRLAQVIQMYATRCDTQFSSSLESLRRC